MWVDAPFFDLLQKFVSLQSFFLQQAWFLGKIVMSFNVGIMLIKYAIRGSDLVEPLTKLGIAFLSFWILLNAYPKLVSGLNNVIYEWCFRSTYSVHVADIINKTQDDYEFWSKKGDKADAAYSDIIRVVEEELGNGEIGKKYVLDIFEPGTGYIRPNALVRLLMLICENIMNRAGNYSIFNGLPQMLLLFLTAIAVVLCGILGALQYFICALEFTLITSVGVIMLPFMIWDGSKFLTEKLIGAIVGFAVKMLFTTIALLLTFNGYLALMVRDFSGAFDQVIYTVFVSFFYMMICQSAPQLAVSLLTGTPQMSLMEGMAAAGAYAAAGIAGMKATSLAGRTAAQGGMRAIGATSQAAGAAKAAGELGGSRGDMAGAALHSLGSSGGQGFKSVAHSMGRSLYGSQGRGASSSYQGSGYGGTNRFSQTPKINEPNAEGHSKTVKEYAHTRYVEGKDKGLDFMARKEEKERQKSIKDQTQNYSTHGVPYKMPPLPAGYYPEGHPRQGVPFRNTEAELPAGYYPEGHGIPLGNHPPAKEPDKPAGFYPEGHGKHSESSLTQKPESSSGSDKTKNKDK